MLNIRPEHLDSEAAEDLAGQLLDDAMKVVEAGDRKVSNRACGEAIGYGGGDSADVHFREHRKGTRPLTLPKLLQLLAHKPAVGRALLAGITGWYAARFAPAGTGPVLEAVRELVTAALALAVEGHAVTADNDVDGAEERRMLAASDRVERAITKLRAACAPKAARKGAAS